ncbi:UDP-GlcNAc:betaGal beta-1,3-N-acetylglucosaminyltransferase-like protein 1 [Toxocara canis]|uniref:UDP-GlcNAc:betaGal beta-1,3-N-acetylglucosaminyltransferase-like protein 1 n=1 Tax=Toxocara canis TaxID=6265 RepID=A0A0B2V8W9_TOXCA|nr:UDP-GlcNAc:betaGal beta-1,3-N-acetylglucosaminyltransferase-like protein 1 [Toxocara canis]
MHLTDNVVTVSAIVPVKNGSRWLPECLDSLLNQQLPNAVRLQVSIYDDASTDDTMQIAQSYRSKFIAKKIDCKICSGSISRGVGFAKNRAVRQSDGRFLCFCDADDINCPSRVRIQLAGAMRCCDPMMAFVGSRFRRLPGESTKRFTKWANSLSDSQLCTQIFTSHGPTLVAPTWFISRYLFDLVGGFHEEHPVGYPEDLRFFYEAFKIGARFIRVDEYAVTYRYHMGCASFAVPESTIWDMRIAAFEQFVLPKWNSFTIWNAGKQGKRFYRSLNKNSRSKVVAFCDVDRKKIARGSYEHFDHASRTVTAVIPIIPVEKASPPVAICMKLDLTDGVFEALIGERGWNEGVDFYYLS